MYLHSEKRDVISKVYSYIVSTSGIIIYTHESNYSLVRPGFHSREHYEVIATWKLRHNGSHGSAVFSCGDNNSKENRISYTNCETSSLMQSSAIFRRTRGAKSSTQNKFSLSADLFMKDYYTESREMMSVCIRNRRTRFLTKLFSRSDPRYTRTTKRRVFGDDYGSQERERYFFPATQGRVQGGIKYHREICPRQEAGGQEAPGNYSNGNVPGENKQTVD